MRTLPILTLDAESHSGTFARTGPGVVCSLSRIQSVLLGSPCHSLHPSCQGAERVNMGSFHLLSWKVDPAFHLESYSGEFRKQK